MRELGDLGIWPSKLSKKIKGVDLSEQEYDDYQRTAGRFMRIRLSSIVNTPGWQAVPPSIRRSTLTATIKDAREGARTLILMQNPHIIMDSAQSKLADLRGDDD